MNNEEAKFILQGYRPNGADAGDETFAAALEQAKRDPALGAWFAQQLAFDAALSAKLGRIVPPADLRSAILAGGRASAGATPVRAWWNHPVWMGAAASVAILMAAGLALWPKQASAFDDFAYADARLGPTHGHEGNGAATGALQLMLSQPTTKLGQKLPVSFATLHETGCRTVNYREADVLEVCFERNGEWFHVYIGRAADFPDRKPGAGLTIVDKPSGAVATWADGEHVIVVVSNVGRQSLEALL
ncbi:hypothetical protein Verru16b_00036 [Lacunisphaera limnophila]|uniref:DUF3379 domain-containing protein n=1 Tax=Lacunisphaera limnophila TaxID=1838286 RepID=A0A1I7PHC2_9BACT|nr:hypothetical protein [Lacunisphaera limnophila]AOS42998.1 hypothetical protein Verru16b_00036 [Lacunisphaera limnophila]